MKPTFETMRMQFKPEDGWAVRSWLTHMEDGRCVVQVSLSDAEDHVVASTFGESTFVTEAEDDALGRLVYSVYGVPCE